MKLFQQTVLTMSELLENLKNGESNYPKCLLLNEIGAACQNGNDTPDKDGEKYLLSLLSARGRQERIIAFCALSRLEGKNEDVLANFRGRARNRRIMPEIKRMLKD